jgi:membrane protein implicated in regulation of membrane protease activity
MNNRTIWLGVGFVLLSAWAIVHLHDGYQLVLFCCAMGLLVYLLEKFVKA